MSQAEAERAIFLEFLPASGLRVDVESVENRNPPEPDIVCHVDGRGIVGFELTELIDSGFMARLNLMARTKQHLSDAWQTGLTSSKTAEFKQKYGNALLHFVYQCSANQRQRERVTLAILRALLELPNGIEGTVLKNVDEFSPVQEIRIRRGKFAGPILDVDSIGWLGDPTAPTIRKKLSNAYECEYPLHLLAYIQIDLLPPEEAWIAAADEAAEALADSQFERIWVFDRTSRSVRYDRSVEQGVL